MWETRQEFHEGNYHTQCFDLAKTRQFIGHWRLRSAVSKFARPVSSRQP
jgi:hypothetical protein